MNRDVIVEVFCVRGWKAWWFGGCGKWKKGIRCTGMKD